MGFNLPGKSITSGTSAHSSALKMKTEASALKAKNPKAKTYGKAYYDLDYKNPETEGENAEDYTKVDKWGREYGKKGESGKVGEAEFTKAAEDWNMKTYGTKNPTKAANAANMTKKEYAARYKANKTKADSKTTVATKGENKGKTVVSGLGAKKSKTLTPNEKAAEKTLREGLKTNISDAKKTGDKNKRDENQMKLGESRAGKDNKKTGTVVSRYLAKRKVKRNKRQLAKRKAEENA